MPREFKLPDVGEGVAEGEIVRWLVEEGDRVEEDQPVAEVETDKAVVEVPSPYDGKVRKLHYDEGDVVPVGEVIVTYDVEGEDEMEEAATEAEIAKAEAGKAEAGKAETGKAEAGEAEAPAEVAAETAQAGEIETEVTETIEAETVAETGRTFAPPSVRSLARRLGVDLDSVHGTEPHGRISETDVRRAASGRRLVEAEEGEKATEESAAEEGAAEEVAAEVAAGEPEEEGEVEAEPQVPMGEQTAHHIEGKGAEEPAVETAERERTLAAPKTRKVAEELGVDIHAVPAVEEREGKAFVTEEAVREYAEKAQRAKEGEAAAPAAAGGPEAPVGGGEREERIPYRGIRRTIGERMEKSKYTAPHVTHHDTAEISSLVETRADLKPVAEERGVKLTYMPFVMKALVAGLKQYPELNASLDEEAEEIVRKKYYNFGIAVATDAGLMVPVVKNVDEKGILELAEEVHELARKAREREIEVSEMRGGTFTITNFGAIGGEYATPIINYPEVAIMGLGSIEERPVVEDGEVVARETLPLSLSIDHRVVDGAVAAEFTNEVMAYLNNPKRLLLE